MIKVNTEQIPELVKSLSEMRRMEDFDHVEIVQRRAGIRASRISIYAINRTGKYLRLDSISIKGLRKRAEG